MASPLLIVIGIVVVNAFLLLSEEAREESALTFAWRISGATLVTITLAAPFMYAARVALVEWHDVDVFINSAIIAGVALLLVYLARLRLPRLLRSMRSAPLLIVSNGIALATALRGMLLETAIGFFFSATALAAGFGILLVAFVPLCERVSNRDVPKSFRHAPITFVTAGLVALALIGFAGIL